MESYPQSTARLTREGTSIRTDEKWRHDFMTPAQKMTEQRTFGDHSRVVRQVRNNRNVFSIDTMAKFMQVPIDDSPQRAPGPDGRGDRRPRYVGRVEATKPSGTGRSPTDERTRGKVWLRPFSGSFQPFFQKSPLKSAAVRQRTASPKPCDGKSRGFDSHTRREKERHLGAHLGGRCLF